MVDYLTENTSVRVILVEKVDRLYRNPKDWIILEELGVEIHFIKENTIIAPDSRSSDKLMHGIKVVMAKNYIDNLKEEVKNGIHEKAAQGMWPSQAPFGYFNTKDPETREKIISPDPEESIIVLSIFRWCAEGYTLDEIVDLCRKAGYRYGRTRATIRRSLIHRILRSLVYTGNFYWGGIFYHGRYAALVSQELWQRAQDSLNGRGAKRKDGPHVFTYKGLITCGFCGCAVTGDIKKGKYVYYAPTGYPSKCTRDPKQCRSIRLREEELDPQLTEAMGSLEVDEELLEWVRAAWDDGRAQTNLAHEAAIDRLEAEAQRLQKRLDAMYVDKLEGRIEEVQFARLSNQWQLEQVEALRQIQSRRAALKSKSDEGVRLLEFANEALATFENQDPAQKRRLLKIVLSNCRWDDGKLTAEFRQPFEFILKKKSTGSRRSLH